MSYGKYVLDPSEIETTFAVEDGMAFMDSIFDEPSEEALLKIEDVKRIMEGLPPREADFVDLYYFRKMTQTDIAVLFGVSQPTICYRLQRAAHRIHFLFKLPHVDEDEMLEDLDAFLSDPMDTQIMALMWKITCQSEVAKYLGVTQGFVRHRFLRSISRMKSFVALPQTEADLVEKRVALSEKSGTVEYVFAEKEYQMAMQAMETFLGMIPQKLKNAEAFQRFSRYLDMYLFMSQNLNLMREIQRGKRPDVVVARAID